MIKLAPSAQATMVMRVTLSSKPAHTTAYPSHTAHARRPDADNA